MHSDLERARQTWEEAKLGLEQIEKADPQTPEDARRHEAMLHLARLRSYVALGRVIALERSRHAHRACEEAPTSCLC